MMIYDFYECELLPSDAVTVSIMIFIFSQGWTFLKKARLSILIQNYLGSKRRRSRLGGSCKIHHVFQQEKYYDDCGKERKC